MNNMSSSATAGDSDLLLSGEEWREEDAVGEDEDSGAHHSGREGQSVSPQPHLWIYLCSASRLFAMSDPVGCMVHSIRTVPVYFKTPSSILDTASCDLDAAPRPASHWLSKSCSLLRRSWAAQEIVMLLKLAIPIVSTQQCV